MRQLSKRSDTTLLLASRAELDLMDKTAVNAFMQDQKPDQVCFAAAKVGGIHATTPPSSYRYLIIQANKFKRPFRQGA